MLQSMGSQRVAHDSASELNRSGTLPLRQALWCTGSLRPHLPPSYLLLSTESWMKKKVTRSLTTKSYYLLAFVPVFRLVYSLTQQIIYQAFVVS